MMLSQRLDKLEGDLKLLVTMHDLFFQSDTESGRDAGGDQEEVPVRDTNVASKKKVKKKKDGGNGGAEVKEEDDKGKDPAAKEGPVVQVEELLERDRLLREEGEKERTTLKEALGREHDARKETEESAKHVYLQLQKVMEELRREKEMREELLVDNFQLKTSLEESHLQVSRLQEKTQELQKLEGRVQAVATEKANLVQRLGYLCEDLGFKKGRGSFGGDVEEVYLEWLEEQCKALKKTSVREEGSSEQIRRLTSQLNTAVGRLATTEMDRDKVKEHLLRSRDSEETLKKELHTSQLAVTKMEGDLIKKQMEWDCTLQKITGERGMERKKYLEKINAYSRLFRESKQVILHLRGNRDQGRRHLQEEVTSRRAFERQVKELLEERQRWKEETQKLLQKVDDVTSKSQEEWKKWQEEKGILEATLSKMGGERRKLLDLLGQMKTQLVALKRQRDQDLSLHSVEKEKLLEDAKRLRENFQVLQKITEDQGATITKLRGDLDSERDTNRQLTGDLRDYQSAEGHLLRKLEEAEVNLDQCQDTISQLSSKITRYDQELRDHDCTHFVESQFQRKVAELEELLEEKGHQWQKIRRNLQQAKEEAVEETKKLGEKITSLEKSQEEELRELKGRCKEEMMRQLEAYRKRDEERVAKIQELDRAIQSGAQVQVALSSKIKQLQSALGLCLGSSANLFQNQSQNQPGFGSSSIINPDCCTSAAFSAATGTSTTTAPVSAQTRDPFSVDFITNLFL